MMDQLDVDLLKSVADHENGIVREIIRPFIHKYGESKLRRHITNLAVDGLVKLDRRRGHNRVFVAITNEGHKVIA